VILLPCPLAEVDALCARYHAYQGASGVSVYSFGVYEGSDLVAAYAWQPPPYGSAKSVNPHAPWAVLSLSRMVAVPRSERALKHVSKPLLRQMKRLIDRTRWPSLVTYSDEGLGHDGYVYKCSGWTPTRREEVNQYEDSDGRRTSPYSNGEWSKQGLTFVGKAYIQRWEHHVVPVEDTARYIEEHGWIREPIPGKFWKSGKPAHRIVQRRVALT
jgi:hypothetical protein